MTTLEIRDPDEARLFLAQGLWLRGLEAPSPSDVSATLRRTLELAGEGEPIPPVGVVGDIGQILLDRGGSARAGRDRRAVPGWPAGLARRYEDLVLGKLDADPSLNRASDALVRYKGRDRDRGLAFVLARLRERAGFDGVLLSPAALKSAAESPARELLDAGWDSFTSSGVHPSLVGLYESLIRATRDMHDAVGPEDVFELEHGTAVAAFGQRVALRQVLRAAARFEAKAPRDRPKPVAGRHDLATRFLDEDSYPVGGFSSISTKGSVESLLHSQLAYMERDERPDLFDIKYARDELLYYSRDENQFHRRRRTLVFGLHADLARARVKDVGLDYQRVVLLLGLLTALARRFTEWLTDEALVFEFLFVKGTGDPLVAERELVQMLFREAVANGTAVVESVDASGFSARCAARAGRSLCQVLQATAGGPGLAADGVSSALLRLDRARPALGLDGEDPAPVGADDAPSDWQSAFDRLLVEWA